MIGSNTKTILLVDDNPGDLFLLQDQIENIQCEWKYHCMTAQSSNEAISIYSAHHVDCAFVDYNMPGRTGIQLVHMLSQLPRYQDSGQPLPIVIVSSVADSQLMHQVRESRAMRFTLKQDLTSSVNMQVLIQHMLNSDTTHMIY